VWQAYRDLKSKLLSGYHFCSYFVYKNIQNMKKNGTLKAVLNFESLHCFRYFHARISRFQCFKKGTCYPLKIGQAHIIFCESATFRHYKIVNFVPKFALKILIIIFKFVSPFFSRKKQFHTLKTNIGWKIKFKTNFI